MGHMIKIVIIYYLLLSVVKRFKCQDKALYKCRILLLLLSLLLLLLLLLLLSGYWVNKI